MRSPAMAGTSAAPAGAVPTRDVSDDAATWIVDGHRDLLTQERLGPAREDDFELLAERRRLGVEDPGLVRRAVELDGRRVAGAALGAPLEPELAVDRRSGVDEMDLDRDPRAK